MPTEQVHLPSFWTHLVHGVSHADHEEMTPKRDRRLLFKQSLFAIGSAVALFACQDLDPSALSGYRATYPANKAADRLQGSWSATCSGGNPSTRSKLLFFNRQISVITLQFDDSVCGKQMEQLTIGKDFTLPLDENATTQTLVTTARLGQMGISTGYAATANTASLCGLTNWQEKSSVDVTGKSCFTTPVSVPTFGTTANETVVFGVSSTLTFTGTSLSAVVFTKDP